MMEGCAPITRAQQCISESSECVACMGNGTWHFFRCLWMHQLFETGNLLASQSTQKMKAVQKTARCIGIMTKERTI